ncbi:unnamed protein product [Thlaspi arvense]|uniref:NAD-dependent epimerase/dehydratase domain-containing protein n=1 Tax=Thlaspi arvense TaxID=13288 RepID=A0AAU9SLX5_THLAR|nr:unnamed protein product [Thlaspi arvense]
MDGVGKVVCVTGASGYVASWIVKLLLLRGYTVRATVRDPNDQKKTEHLLALDGAKERLKLFKADLLEEGSFEEAINGCSYVIHTATPVSLDAVDPQAELIDPAVKGTLNVLKSCKRSLVNRVVLTSSMAAIIAHDPCPNGTNDVADETTFSDPKFCEKKKLWYALAKTLAENAAWEHARDNEIDLVVMNPGLVIGPVLHASLNFSVGVVVGLINGKDPFNSGQYRFVDVRDVALAHIKAIEDSAASGRYIIDGPVVKLNDDIEKVLREFYPDLCFADEKKNVGMFELDLVTYKVRVEKVKSLGIELTPMETSLRDTVLSLKEKCLV